MVSYRAPGVDLALDYKGIGQVLNSPQMGGAITEAAHAVARNLGNLPGVSHVYVDAYSTDRRAAAVSIPDFDGAGVEAKYGALSNAALDAGLEVNRK